MKKRRIFNPSKKQIYIVPNAYGLLCFFNLILVFITGFVVGNSTLYLFGFALTTFFFTAMVQTNNNMRGLSVQFAKFESCYAGDQIVCLVTLNNKSTVPRYQVRLRISSPQKEESDVMVETCSALQTLSERGAFKGLKRGIFKAPRLKISSQYPLGIFYAWKVHHSEMEYVVYPRPEGTLPLPDAFTDLGAMDQTASFLQGNEDFYGLHLYTQADPPGRIAWNTLARGGPLTAKSFESPSASACVLDYDRVAADEVETRLSQLAVWILMCEQSGVFYQLRLPREELGPGSGPEFAHACFRLLALFKPAFSNANGPLT